MADEKILGSLEVTESGSKKLMFFTPQEVVVAMVQSSGVRNAAGLMGGAIGGYLAGRSAEKTKKEMTGLSPGEILKKDERNYAIAYPNCLRVEVKKPGMMSSGKLKIVTSTGEKEFTIDKKKDFENQMNLPRSVLGSKLQIT